MAYNLNSPEFQSAAASKLHAAYANLLESSNKQHMLSILFPGLHECIATGRNNLNGFPPRHISQQVNRNLPGLTSFVENANSINTAGPPYYDPRIVESLFTKGVDLAHREVWNSFNNAQMSFLTPFVSFATKTVNSNNEVELRSIPLQNMQPAVSNYKSIYGNSNLAFGFLGLKDVDVELAGRFEETRFSDIKVAVQYAGNSLQILSDPVYLPLVSPATDTNQLGIGHELVMEFGWNPISSQAQKSLKFTRPQVQFIEQQTERYALYYYKHDFNIDMDGSFTLTVNYIGRAAEVLKQIDLGSGPLDEIARNYPATTLGSARQQRDPQLAPLVQMYISEMHPSISYAASNQIYNHFSEMQSLSGLDAVTTSMKSRKSSQRAASLKNLQLMTEFLRNEKLEFATAIPTINRRIKLMRCAVLSAFYDQSVFS